MSTSNVSALTAIQTVAETDQVDGNDARIQCFTLLDPLHNLWKHECLRSVGRIAAPNRTMI